MTRQLYLNRRSDAAPPRASRMEKSSMFCAAVWQGGKTMPRQRNMRHLTLLLFATQVFATTTRPSSRASDG